MKALAKEADTILVVGSQTSSNSKSLRQVAEGHGARSFLIDGPEDLTDEMVLGANAVGVTAGASAPEHLVQAVVSKVRALGGGENAVQLEDFIVLEEEMEFKLPPGLTKLKMAG